MHWTSFIRNTANDNSTIHYIFTHTYACMFVVTWLDFTKVWMYVAWLLVVVSMRCRFYSIITVVWWSLFSSAMCEYFGRCVHICTYACSMKMKVNILLKKRFFLVEFASSKKFNYGKSSSAGWHRTKLFLKCNLHFNLILGISVLKDYPWSWV